MEQQPATEESREHHDQYLPLPASSVRELKEEKVANKRAADERRKKEQAVKLNLAGVAVSLNVRLRSADMPPVMQERAFRFTRSLLFPPHHQTTPSTNPNPSSTQIARALKKEFDRWYGPAWHCVVGKSFGSFVTHSEGGFLYFSVENLSVLLFKTAVRPVMLDMDIDIRPSSYNLQLERT